MTRETLKNYIGIKNHIEELEQRIKSLRDQLERIEDDGKIIDTAKDYSSGFPRTIKLEGFNSRDYTAKKTLLLQRKLEYERQIAELVPVEKEVLEYIRHIGNIKKRMAFTLYYVEGWSQEQTADRLHYERSTISRWLNEDFDEDSHNSHSKGDNIVS